MKSIPYSTLNAHRLQNPPSPYLEGEELDELPNEEYSPLNRRSYTEGRARVLLRAGVKTILTAVVVFAGYGFLEPSFRTGRKVSEGCGYILAIAGWVAYSVAVCFAMFSFVDALFGAKKISQSVSSNCVAYSKRIIKLVVSVCLAAVIIFPTAWAAYKYNDSSRFPRLMFPITIVLSDIWFPAHSTYSSIGQSNRFAQCCSEKCLHPSFKEANQFRDKLITHIDGQNQELHRTWNWGHNGQGLSQSLVEFDPTSAGALLDQYYAETCHLKEEDSFNDFVKRFSHPIGMSRALRLRPFAVGLGRFLGLTQIALAGCLGADGIHEMGGSLSEGIAGGVGISAMMAYYMGGHASAAITDGFDTAVSILIRDYTPSLASQLRWKTTWALRTLLGTASMLSFGTDLTFYDDIVGDRAGFVTIPLKTAIAVGSACFTGHVCMIAAERMAETSVVLFGNEYEHKPIFDSATLRSYKEAVNTASVDELLAHASTIEAQNQPV